VDIKWKYLESDVIQITILTLTENIVFSLNSLYNYTWKEKDSEKIRISIVQIQVNYQTKELHIC